MKCPCLYSDAAPICRAEGDGMRIPAAEELATYCLTAQYRRCEVFRRFLVALTERPERWRSITEFGAGTDRRRKLRGD